MSNYDFEGVKYFEEALEKDSELQAVAQQMIENGELNCRDNLECIKVAQNEVIDEFLYKDMFENPMF